MSGAEALIVLGIIANTAGVIDFTGKILGRIKDASENYQNIPKAFRVVQTTLPLLSHALKQIQQRIDSGVSDEEACAALKPVLQDCQSDISDLNDIFDKCLPKEGSSKFRRGWKAVISLKQDKKVEEISELLRMRVPLLTFHHVTTPASSAMDSVAAGIAASKIADAKRPKIYSMVPVLWADDFTGREEQMSILSSKLSQQGKHVRVAIVGLGGIGKTRIARQYIETQKGFGVSIFWIHAGTAERMKSGSRDIANEVGIPGCDGQDVDILKKVKDWFESETSGRWLLIYDNVDDIDLTYGGTNGRLADYFPRSNRGSIIMTTRNRQIGIKFATARNIIPLSALSDEDSITLMATKLEEDNTETNPDLERLVNVLGGIPLAIIQATSFILENGSTPARYLELYEASESNRLELLSQDFEDDTRDHELKNPIASTWVVTFEYMKTHQPLAADTLCLMSMFDSQAIPEAFISKTAGGDCASSTNLERTLGILQAYSLISVNHDTSASAPHKQMARTFDLHRLVRLVTRNWLTMCSTFNFWVAKAIKDDEGVSVPEIFHGQTLLNEHTTDGLICPTCTGNILRSMVGVGESITGKLQMTKKAVAICSFALGTNHRKASFYKKLEADALSLLKDHASAEMTYREALVGYEATLGLATRETLGIERNIAIAMREQGKHDEAERLLVRLRKLSCQEHGQEDPVTVEITQTLSYNMVAQGRNEEALKLNLEISKLDINIFCKFRLASSYNDMSEYSEAETLYISLLDDEDALVRDGLLDQVLNRLAQIFCQQDQFDKAEGLQRRALAYLQQSFGENSGYTLIAKLDLAKTLYYLEQYHEAEGLLLQVHLTSIEHRIELDGVHANTAAWYLAIIWLELGKHDQSKELALKTIESTRRQLGEQHGQYVWMMESLRDLWGLNPDGTEEISEEKCPSPGDSPDQPVEETENCEPEEQ
ncbi:MAG: hypothetical protein Q9226_003438 [Calogaya cf. arnoldii]